MSKQHNDLQFFSFSENSMFCVLNVIMKHSSLGLCKFVFIYLYKVLVHCALRIVTNVYISACFIVSCNDCM